MSSTKPIIDIIAVAFEKLDELKVFVQSWLNQTEKNWKLTVIHDGPNNKFESIMDSYKKIDSERINFYCTQDRFNDYGHSLREIGLKNVQGEFTLITNADNYFIPKAIEFINQAYFKSECKADVIIYDMIHSHQNPGGRDLPSYSYFKVEYKKNSIDISSAVVKSDLAKKAGFRDKTYAGDATYFEDVHKVKHPDKLTFIKIHRVLFVHN
tara:strand:+ start:1073 stop:1702 length:630 start_codon:yes stop_codon:yes gene_type:complete